MPHTPDNMSGKLLRKPDKEKRVGLPGVWGMHLERPTFALPICCVALVKSLPLSGYQSPHWLQETMDLSRLHTTGVFSHKQGPFLQEAQTPTLPLIWTTEVMSELGTFINIPSIGHFALCSLAAGWHMLLCYSGMHTSMYHVHIPICF